MALRDVDAALQAIVRRARKLLDTDTAYLALYDPAHGCAYMREPVPDRVRGCDGTPGPRPAAFASRGNSSAGTGSGSAGEFDMAVPAVAQILYGVRAGTVPPLYREVLVEAVALRLRFPRPGRPCPRVHAGGTSRTWPWTDPDQGGGPSPEPRRRRRVERRIRSSCRWPVPWAGWDAAGTVDAVGPLTGSPIQPPVRAVDRRPPQRGPLGGARRIGRPHWQIDAYRCPPAHTWNCSPPSGTSGVVYEKWERPGRDVKRAVRVAEIVTSSLARTALSHRICTGIRRRQLGALIAELAGPMDATAGLSAA